MPAGIATVALLGHCRGMDAAAILRSLDLVAEHGDPAAAVYRRLFAAYPSMEALFVRDVDGGVRGNMLAEAVSAIIDFVGTNVYGANLMKIEVVNHENLGVPRDVFPAFFLAMRDTFAETLGSAWTKEIDTAWCDLLRRIDSVLAER